MERPYKHWTQDLVVAMHTEDCHALAYAITANGFYLHFVVPLQQLHSKMVVHGLISEGGPIFEITVSLILGIHKYLITYSSPSIALRTVLFPEL